MKSRKFAISLWEFFSFYTFQTEEQKGMFITAKEKADVSRSKKACRPVADGYA